MPPSKQHSHSHHLPQTPHRPTATPCSHPRLVAACHLARDQILLPFDASRRPSAPCMEAVPRVHQKLMASRQDHPDSPTATTGRPTSVASRSHQTRNPTSPWIFMARAPTPKIRIASYLETSRPDRTANPMDLQDKMIKREGSCTTRLGGGEAHLVRQRNGDERWENRITRDRIPQNFWLAAVRTRLREIAPRLCILCRSLLSAPLNNIATCLARQNPRAAFGVIRRRVVLATSHPKTLAKRSSRHCIARTAHILPPCWAVHVMAPKIPRTCFGAV